MSKNSKKFKIERKGSISAVYIVYNEDDMIERSLKSLKGVVDEIIVCHDGPCSDKTLDIARKYTDRVYVLKKSFHQELHYVEMYNLAKCEWILKLDADEFLSDELRENIRSLAKSDEYDAYSFKWPIWNGKRYISKRFPHKPALFRKSSIKIIESPHRNYLVRGKTRRVQYILEYRPKTGRMSKKATMEKHNRNIKKIARLYFVSEYGKKSIGMSEDEIAYFEKRRKLVIRFPLILVPGAVYAFTIPLIKNPGFALEIAYWRSVFFTIKYLTKVAFEIMRLKASGLREIKSISDIKVA